MFKWIIKKFSGDKKEETLPEGTHTKPVVIKAEPKKKKAPAKKFQRRGLHCCTDKTPRPVQ